MHLFHSRAFSMILLASSAAAFWPQAAGASDFPYWGIVTADAVDVHSGAGDSYYVAGQLRHGAVVQVHSHFHRWFKVTPPEGVFSYVKKAFINRQGDVAAGVVTRDRVVVKTAAVGDGPPGASYRQQRFMRRGEQVQIVAKRGDYYRIVPPADTYVFLPPGSVSPATAEQIAAAGVATDPQVMIGPVIEQIPVKIGAVDTQVIQVVADQPQVVEAVAEPAEVPEQAAAAVMAVSIDAVAKESKVETTVIELPEATRPATADQAKPALILAASPEVQAVEIRLAAVSQRPLSEQPVSELLATYEALNHDTRLSRGDRRIVRTRLVVLRRRAQLAQTLHGIETFRQQLKQWPASSADTFEKQNADTYAAVGRLVSSIVYNGERLPVLYRVVEPTSSRTLAYVRPGSKTQVARCLGKLVGVVGHARFDSALKLLVVEAERVDTLEAIDDQVGDGAESNERLARGQGVGL